jgi:dihydroorotase
VVDAGSVGAGSWGSFRDDVIAHATTNVLGFMNISLFRIAGPRHGVWSNYDPSWTIPLVEEEAAAGHCVGVKVLASQTHVGNLDITPVELARQAARLSGTKLMVHIGNAPPVIDEVLNLLGEGDIVTHCWHGKYGGLLDRHRQPLPETRAAVERGVKFDIGHGSASFSFATARDALAAGLPLHSISTDLHGGNVNGPVYDQATTMAKFLHLGLDLPEVIRLVTVSPAALIGRADTLGSLQPGRVADVTVFRLIDGPVTLTDSGRVAEQADRSLEVVYTVRAGAVAKEPADHA